MVWKHSISLCYNVVVVVVVVVVFIIDKPRNILVAKTYRKVQVKNIINIAMKMLTKKTKIFCCTNGLLNELLLYTKSKYEDIYFFSMSPKISAIQKTQPTSHITSNTYFITFIVLQYLKYFVGFVHTLFWYSFTQRKEEFFFLFKKSSTTKNKDAQFETYRMTNCHILHFLELILGTEVSFIMQHRSDKLCLQAVGSKSKSIQNSPQLRLQETPFVLGHH